MSTYEEAPATLLVATSCCVCHRPLVDAISVEVGMGPDCRKKYYTASSENEANRPRANQIVHGLAVGSQDVPSALMELQLLGFDKLSSRLAERLCKIVIETPGDTNRLGVVEEGFFFLVTTPYSPTAVEDLRRIPGRRWDAEAKGWLVPRSARPSLHRLLCRHFPGALARGPKGFFVISEGK